MPIFLDILQITRTILSESSEFQDWVGAADAAEALGYIDLFEAVRGDRDKWAAINPAESAGSERIATGGDLDCFENSQAVTITFYKETTAHSSAEATTFLTEISTIWADYVSTANSRSGKTKIIDRFRQIPATQENPFQWHTKAGEIGYQMSIEEDGRF